MSMLVVAVGRWLAAAPYLGETADAARGKAEACRMSPRPRTIKPSLSYPPTPRAARSEADARMRFNFEILAHSPFPKSYDLVSQILVRTSPAIRWPSRCAGRACGLLP